MAELTEDDVIQRLLPQLEAEGYEVLVHPNRLAVPEFLGNYRPDILARRSDGNIVFEVKRRRPNTGESTESIAKLVQDRKGWEFRMIWIEPTAHREILPVQTRTTIQQSLDEVRAVASNEHREIAMLMAWGVFEAVARALKPDEIEAPQRASALLERLAGDGVLTPSEADKLRALYRKRNRLAHGELQEKVAPEELGDLLDVTDELVKMLPAPSVVEA